VVESDFTTLGGYQATMALLALKSRPTALFVANNLMTIGALKALKEKGISVPQEMAIIGFDDHELSDLVDPPLTVISRDAHLQGALAMQTLLEKIRGGNQFPPKQLKVDVNLVVRGSCGSTCRYRNSKTSEFPKTLSASSRSK
jgi:LacI family transcriptional regulator